MQLPLLFSFAQVVLGSGFIAGVRMTGRALLEQEPLETWITGVAPVGLSGGGLDRSAAFADFRTGWAQILFDIAAESTSFEDFKQECERFLSSAQASFTQEWEAAVDEVRRTGYVDPALNQKPADEPVSFQVVELTPSKYGPDANEVEGGLLQAAA